MIRLFDTPITSKVRLFPAAPVAPAKPTALPAQPFKLDLNAAPKLDTQPLVSPSNIIAAGKPMQNVNDIRDPSLPDDRSKAVRIIDHLLSIPDQLANPSLIAQSLADSAVVTPKDKTPYEQAKAIGLSLLNLPTAAIGQFIVSPALSAAASIAEAIGERQGLDMTEGLGGTLKLYGNARGVDYAGAQKIYNDAIQRGVRSDAAFIDSAAHLGMSLAIAVPLARNMIKIGYSAYSPRSLLETMDMTRQSVQNILADRPVRPDILKAFKDLSPEMKSKAARGLLSMAPKPEPSLLGRILGLSKQEAQALFDEVMTTVQRGPNIPYGGELPGYAIDGPVGIKAGLGIQRVKKVGGAPEVPISTGTTALNISQIKPKGYSGASDFIQKTGIDPASVRITDDKTFIVESDGFKPAILTELPVAAFGNPEFTTLNQESYAPGKKITDPIRVSVVDGKYKITDGANRFTQALANGDKTIPAIVEIPGVDAKAERSTSKEFDIEIRKYSGPFDKNFPELVYHGTDSLATANKIRKEGFINGIGDRVYVADFVTVNDVYYADNKQSRIVAAIVREGAKPQPKNSIDDVHTSYDAKDLIPVPREIKTDSDLQDYFDSLMEREAPTQITAQQFKTLPEPKREQQFSELSIDDQESILMDMGMKELNDDPLANLANEIAAGRQKIQVGRDMHTEAMNALGKADYMRVFTKQKTASTMDEFVHGLEMEHGIEKTTDDLLEAIGEALNRRRENRLIGIETAKKLIAERKEQRALAKTEKEKQAFLKELSRDIYANITKKRYTAAQMAKKTEAANERIAKVKTAKDILARRRSLVRAVQAQFGLSDNDMQTVTQRDIRLMDNLEFKEFLDNVRIKAEELADTRQARAQVVDTIVSMELKHTDNLREAMKLPSLEKMTKAQLDQFNEAMQSAKTGDDFLSVRKLQTVDRTDLKGVRTVREAKERLAQEIQVPIESLDNIKVGTLDRYRYDTALAEKNPFYALLVDSTNKAILTAEERYLRTEQEINTLIAAARASVTRGPLERLIPQDKLIFNYLEASGPEKVRLAQKMTPEELAAANLIRSKYAEMRDYLIQNEGLKKYRQDYITHIRRGFFEAIKEDGIVTAIKEVVAQYVQEEAIFNIIDDTSQILPLEKFFKFSLRRSGELRPTHNVAAAFLSYSKAFEKKVALDSIVPKLDIYTHVLTPTKLTPRGLEMDHTLKAFVNEWINTKKGRTAKIVGIEQGGRIDLLLRALKTITSLIDLGLNVPIGLASRAGEAVTNVVMLGPNRYALGVVRARTAKGKLIIDKYRSFVGQTPWEELQNQAHGPLDKVFNSMFALFKDASVRANKTYLLGSLTAEEFAAGEVSSLRLAQMKRDMGRYRAVEGAKSIVGSTSLFGLFTQYKSWAIPVLRTTVDNLARLARTRDFTGREANELLRSIVISLTLVFVVKAYIGDDEDDSFFGDLLRRVYRDAMTITAALDPKNFGSIRAAQFIKDLSTSLSQIIKLEQYKASDEYKGINSLLRTLTPRAIKNILPEDYGTAPTTRSVPGGLGKIKSKSGGLPGLNGGSSRLPGL